MKVVITFNFQLLQSSSFHFQKNFTGVDDFAKSMLKGEFFMGDPRATDDLWHQAAKENQYDNLLMVKFEDILGKTLTASLTARYIIVNSRQKEMGRQNRRVPWGN